MSYRISTVAEMTGIPRNTLIAWERRYALLTPRRHENGYRYYNDEDVGLLLQIKNALQAGLKISEAVNIVRRKQARPVMAASGADAQGSREPASPYAEFRAELVEHLLAYRGDEARAMLAQLVNVPFDIKLHEVVFPVLKTIGDLWEQGIASVAQEHFASAIFRANLAALLVTAVRQPRTARHAACTTLPQDDHEIPALALAVQLGQSGYRVSYLGPKMPFLDLCGFVDTQKPNLLCISCIVLPSEEEFMRYLNDTTYFVQQGVRVVFGGQRLADLKITAPPGIEICPSWLSFIA